MRYLKIMYNLFFMIMLFQSCDYVEGLHKDGEITELENSIESFSSIIVNIPVHIVLEQTNEYIIRISGLDFKVNNLNFMVEDGILTISSSGDQHTRQDQMPTVYLPINSLNKITLNAPTELKSADELMLNTFTLIVNGRGTYSESTLNLNCQSVTIAAFGKNEGVHRIEGSADMLNLTMEGSAWTDASLMNVSQVTINQRSIKSSYIHATEKLLVNMYSSGHVFFKGQPVLEYQTYDPGWDVKFGSAIRQND